MRALVTVSDARTGSGERVLLEADGGVRLDEVLPRLAAVAAADLHGGPLAAVVDGRFVGPLDPLDSIGLRDGAVVRIGSRGDVAAFEGRAADSLVELRVVSGPGAGAVAGAWRGELIVGSDAGAGLRIDDEYRVAPSELVVLVESEQAVTVRSAGAATSATLDGAALGPEPTPWPIGGQVELGGRLIELAVPDYGAAATQPSADGSGLDYNRPPRILPPESAVALRLPAPPPDLPSRPLPIIGALTPLAMAAGSALVFHSYYFLLIAALSPVIMVVTFLTDRRRGRVSRRAQQARYREHKAAVEDDAQAALVRERTELLRSAPDAAALAEIATRPLPRLWERRVADPDHLRLRLGTVTQPSRVTLDDPEQLEHRRHVTWEARDVPAVVQLAERGVVGIAGWGCLPRRLAEWAVAQIGVLQSPRDVQLYLLTDSAGAASWDWACWLPHLRPGLGQDSVASVGVTAATTARRIAELGALIEARRTADGTAGSRRWSGPEIVVVIDGARRLRSMPGFVQILKDGPAFGVYSLCIDADERSLPEECTAVAIAEPHGAVVVRQQRVDVLAGIRPDVVDDGWLERVARAVAPLRDASPEGDDAAIPTASRLLDVLHLDPPTVDAIEAGWLVSSRSTTAVIGESIDGAFAIDLRADGPHALIAGTTGSGKSELLQTLVATLAVANRPDEMNFVLVDYKGGAAFKDCVDLPHTVGMVTDLDAHLVERALESLGAELRTREQLLAAAGAKDLEDYLDLRTPGLAPIARLVIVIDEFASLARELPDFVRGLVNIAQRGRSLGIHLILATQRPSGVVSPEIRANTNLRIALRVTDGAESSDVIDAPDAGRIPPQTPGRAYARLGAASLVPFQTARVGGRRIGAASTGPAEPFVRALSFADLADPEPRPPSADRGRGDAEDTDLRALVGAIGAAATRAGIAPQRRPWLPPLPGLLTVEQLWAEHPAPKPLIAYGLEDLPDEQSQRPAAIDLDTFGHLFVVGAPRSGRSQALRTLGAVLAAKVRASDLHLYGIDCGNGALLPLGDFPHAGAIAQRHQTERVQRLLARLTGELTRRQALLAASGFASLPEQRVAHPSGERLAHIVLLIDLWEGFVASLGAVEGGALVEQVQLLLREGASVGIHVVISGDRQLLSGRMSTFVDDKLVLRLTDRSDYSLAGLNPRSLPEEIAPGRAFRAGSGVEVQIAVLHADTAGAAQAGALRAIAAQATRRDAGMPDGRRPFRIDVLPTDLTVADALDRSGPERGRLGWALVGVGGDELRARGVELLGDASTFIVAGPPKSGRSTVLRVMASTLLAGGASVVVLAPRPSPLRELAGATAVLTAPDPSEDELSALFDGARDRVLVVDDGELLRDASAKDWLRDLVRGARERGVGVVLGGDIAEVAAGFSGWQVEVRKGRRGILLSPQNITDGDLVGARLPRSSITPGVQPGRGLANLGDGELVLLQLPQ